MGVNPAKIDPEIRCALLFLGVRSLFLHPFFTLSPSSSTVMLCNRGEHYSRSQTTNRRRDPTDAAPSRAIDNCQAHQVRRTWALGAMQIHVTSSPWLSMKPSSLVATNPSSSTVTPSSPPSSTSGAGATSELTCCEVTNVGLLLGRTPGTGAIS